MIDSNFIPLHITAKHNDFIGNHNAGRYVFVPGSDSRAKTIANYFDNKAEIRPSSRGHNLYLGTITKNNITIDVASISTGMGTSSADIIINELLKLGAKKFLRVGTCGLLQPKFMQGGDLAVATSAIKDEHTTSCYVPKEYPAIASIEMINAISAAAKKINKRKIHYGVFHTKSSLYAREFKQGAMKQQNTDYMDIIKNAGAIASEMEAAMLFTLCNLADAQQMGNTNYQFKDQVLSGAICSVLGEEEDFGTPEMIKALTEDMIELGIDTFFELNKLNINQ
ncbi:nucleoside phosphorylase [Thiotrichales bacterium 19S3-7]|nr:nucleoside phosphorylase [Thiotrichales bacterium 19S3-7]MCF6802814.1 nucleoside phosphorylase [Thiotrichales bacterium 19S3-11]